MQTRSGQVLKSVKSVKSTTPTVSVSKSKSYATKRATEAKSYKDMSVKEKMEYDLAKLEANENDIKNTLKNKGYNYESFNKYIDKDLGRYEPDIKHIKNLRYAGMDIISIRINEDKFSNQTFSINKIQKLSDPQLTNI